MHVPSPAAPLRHTPPPLELPSDGWTSQQSIRIFMLSSGSVANVTFEGYIGVIKPSMLISVSCSSFAATTSEAGDQSQQ